MANFDPPPLPNTIKEYFTPILFGLINHWMLQVPHILNARSVHEIQRHSIKA